MSGPNVAQDDSGRQILPSLNLKAFREWAAILSIGAVVVHALDAQGHLTEWWGFAAYFVTAAAFQFFYGFGLLLRPWAYDGTGGLRENPDRHGRPYYILGLVLSGSIVVLYIITRTTGMPFLGKGAGIQPVTVLGLLPIVENVPLIYCLEELLRRTRHQPAPALQAH